jgi:hypothetical protein
MIGSISSSPPYQSDPLPSKEKEPEWRRVNRQMVSAAVSLNQFQQDYKTVFFLNSMSENLSVRKRSHRIKTTTSQASLLLSL